MACQNNADCAFMPEPQIRGKLKLLLLLVIWEHVDGHSSHWHLITYHL